MPGIKKPGKFTIETETCILPDLSAGGEMGRALKMEVIGRDLGVDNILRRKTMIMVMTMVIMMIVKIWCFIPERDDAFTITVCACIVCL